MPKIVHISLSNPKRNPVWAQYNKSYSIKHLCTWDVREVGVEEWVAAVLSPPKYVIAGRTAFSYNALNFDINEKYVKLIWGSHRGVDEISILVKCYSLPTGK